MIKRLAEVYRKFKYRKIANYKKIDGWLGITESRALYDVAKNLPDDAKALEIGSWKGKSSFCISKGLKSGKLIVIDPFNASGDNDAASEKDYISIQNQDETSLFEIFKSNMQRNGVYDKIIVKRGYSYEFADEVPALDFLFIDGDHSVEGCTRDYKLFEPKLKKGGYIAFHDFYEHRKDLGPTHVINNYVLKSGEYLFYKQCESLWIGRKL